MIVNPPLMVNLQESKYHDACWCEICVSRLWISIALLAQLNIGVQYWLFTFYWQNPHEVYYANSFQTYWPQLWIVLCIKTSCGYPHFDFLSLHIVLGMPIHLSITTVFTTINSTNSSHRSFQWWERLPWYSSAWVKENVGWWLLGNSDTWHMCIMLFTFARNCNTRRLKEPLLFDWTDCFHIGGGLVVGLHKLHLSEFVQVPW